MRRIIGAALFVALVVTTGGRRAAAQSPALFTGRDAALVGAATAGSVALSFLDAQIARTFNDSVRQLRSPALRTFAKRSSIVTETVLMLGGISVYGIARASGGSENARSTADVALHTTEAVAAGALFIQVIRGALGRARPYVVDSSRGRHYLRDTRPHEFRFLQGFRSFDYRSFPSMHAMASVAAATALTREMRLRHTPHREVIGPSLYALSALPALSRMYLDAHWASDIAMGAFLGVVAGQKAVDYSHEQPRNRVDRAFLRATVIRANDGALSLSFSPF
ncbi:MAG: phosphatase PAP2 family protein [Gemmatimonadaceae bacterium]